MVRIDVVHCVSFDSIMIYGKMNGKVNSSGKKMYDMVSGHLLKIGIFFTALY